MKTVLIKLILFYRKYISGLFPPCCRFTPTCSQYALQSLEYYGAFRGSLMAIKRILRCNPFCKGGYDPVPLPHDSDKPGA
ncbi:MAG: membrane protein insertion efficiency factor YidD [Clostridia bacterium]|nr:membrane protein insertion efficiency factor YidD [Clostridia bacterium]